jgi:hypothetical protein
MKTFILAIGGALFASVLSACVPVRGTGERWMNDQEVEAKDHTTCESFGAVRGSQPYLDCRLRLRSDRSSEDRSRRMMIMLDR